VDGYLTGRENLQMIGRLSRLGRRTADARAEELLEQFDLATAGNRVTKGYSGGMRRRLDLAASLVAWPPVLFLDEPTAGLDPRARRALWSTIADLTRDGCSVLLTTQYLEEADELADSIVLIDEGRVVTTGTSADLKAQVGGDRLELHVPPRTDIVAVADAVAGLGTCRPTLDVEARTVVLPVNEPAALIEVAGRLAAAALAVTDAALRSPSLDDVFLALTGRPARPGRESEAPSIGRAS
jgi:ABC-2 type transport system ATP-binding protein